MKRFLIVTALVVSLMLARALGVSAEDEPQPIDIVTAYYDAINAGDLETAVSYLDEDVLFVNPLGRFEGLEEAGENLAEVIASGVTFDLFDLDDRDGRVVYGYEVFIEGESVETGDGGLTTISDGLIIFDGTVALEAIDIVSSFYNAYNEGDLETALSYISEEAEFINPTGSYSTPETISAHLAGQFDDGIRFDLSDFEYIGDAVHYAYTVYQGQTRLDAGTDGVTIVTGGLITFDGTESTLPDDEA